MLMIQVSIGLPVFACEKSAYTVGVQAIDYTPHYNGVQDEETYFKQFVLWLSEKTGCKFDIVYLPIKRLDLEFESLSIDFMYPDNPNWHNTTDSVNQNRVYSPVLATAIGGTMVASENTNITLASFETLVFPRGFSPVAWYPLQQTYSIAFKEVSDATAALLMVNAKRATGADIELSVAQHLTKKHDLTPLALAKNLPITPTGFHLVTLKHPELMNTISQLVNSHQQELLLMRESLGLIEALPH